MSVSIRSSLFVSLTATVLASTLSTAFADEFRPAPRGNVRGGGAPAPRARVTSTTTTRVSGGGGFTSSSRDGLRARTRANANTNARFGGGGRVIVDGGRARPAPDYGRQGFGRPTTAPIGGYQTDGFRRPGGPFVPTRVRPHLRARTRFDAFGRQVGYTSVAWGPNYQFHTVQVGPNPNWRSRGGRNFSAYSDFGTWCGSDLSWYGGFNNYDWSVGFGWSPAVRWRAYSNYSRPSQWITDFYFGSILATRYELRQQELMRDHILARRMAAQNFALQAQYRDMLNMQINATMMNIQAERSVPVNAYFDSYNGPNTHIYVASETTPVMVTNTRQSCVISSADIIQQAGPVTQPSGPLSDQDQLQAPMRVLQSQPDQNSCPVGSIVQVDVDQLQEFENDLYVGVQNGMNTLNQQFYSR